MGGLEWALCMMNRLVSALLPDGEPYKRRGDGSEGSRPLKKREVCAVGEGSDDNDPLTHHSDT